MIFEHIQAFNGTQSEIPLPEQKRVGAIFDTFVDHTLTDNGHLAAPDRLLKDSRKMLFLDGKHGDEEITIVVSDTPKDSTFKKEISLQHMPKEGQRRRGGDTISYRLGEDGIVRRYDQPGATPDKIEARKADGIDPVVLVEGMQPTESPGVVALRGISLAGQARANSEMAKDFGLNDRPIGEEEFEAVASLVTAAKARSYSVFET